MLSRNAGWKSGNVHWTYCTKDDERTFYGGMLDQDACRRPPGHRATSAGVLIGPRRRREVHYNVRPTVIQPAIFSVERVEGGCSSARRRLLWNVAAAEVCTGSGSGKQRTSLEIGLCWRTTTTEMLPESVEPARVFVLWAGGRSARRFGL